MKQEMATLAGGCFWCTEAIFKRLKGVSSIIAGYCEAAESIQFTFDPAIISYDTLLEVFFHLHDPTSLNRQGADVGPEYRSAIFYHSEEQKKIAEVKMKPGFVTQIVPYTKFIPAEQSHQDYYSKNSYAPYCQVVIDPKIHKLLEDFPSLTKQQS